MFIAQFVFFTNVVIVAYINHQNGIEQDRRAELEEAYQQVSESEARLEVRVRERTRDLQVAADVSRQVTTQLDPTLLLPRLVELTREGFDLYHVAIYLYDDATQTLNYEAGTGELADQIQSEHQHIAVDNQNWRVTEAARLRQPIVVGNVRTLPSFVPDPLLPEIRAELSLPMIVGNTLIGVLTLHSQEANRFTPADQLVLESLAEQIAIALRNAQLFTDTQAARQEAERANQVKSQFLASMSHELRTPLNAILNFSQFVSSGMLGDVNGEQVDVLNKITSSGKHLLSLINDVLDISKIESGALRLFVEDNVDLAAEARTVLAAGEALLEGKPVTLNRDIPTTLPTIVGDKRRIRQIMLNLVSNACKFTESGHVNVSLQHTASQVIFAVEDTGPGIAPDHHEKIFETFHQTEAGLRQQEGTGLGLPISRRLAEAHGGQLWLESAPGEGSTFYASLPVRNPALVETMHATRATMPARPAAN